MYGYVMPKQLLLLATNDQDRTLTVVVDGIKYEYWFNGDYGATVLQARKLQAAKAYGRLITLLKTRSSRYDRLSAAG